MQEDGIMNEPKNLPESDESQVTNISHADVKDIHAESVRMHQADAETISAGNVEMTQSGAGNVKATRVNARQSAMAAVDATEVLAEQAALGYVQADKVSISGIAGAVGARTAEVRNALTGVVFGENVHVAESSRTVVLIGRNIHGNVTTLMDTRSALIAGLVGGLFSGIMLLLGRSLFGRR